MSMSEIANEPRSVAKRTVVRRKKNINNRKSTIIGLKDLYNNFRPTISYQHSFEIEVDDEWFELDIEEEDLNPDSLSSIEWWGVPTLYESLVVDLLDEMEVKENIQVPFRYELYVNGESQTELKQEGLIRWKADGEFKEIQLEIED